MTLDSFFQISVSVFCIVATIFLLIIFVWAIMLKNQLAKLIKKLEEISEIAKTTAAETKEFVERTIESLESFKQSIFTLDFIRRIVEEVMKLFKKNKSQGDKNG